MTTNPIKFKITVEHWEERMSIETGHPADIHEFMMTVKSIALAMGYSQNCLTEYWNDGECS